MPKGLPDERLKDPIRALVREIAAGNYEQLEAEGKLGELSADDIREAVEDYGRTIVALPDEAFGRVDHYEKDYEPGWLLDVPVYTEEEGASDLTLEVETDGSDAASVVVRNLHVL